VSESEIEVRIVHIRLEKISRAIEEKPEPSHFCMGLNKIFGTGTQFFGENRKNGQPPRPALPHFLWVGTSWTTGTWN